jgi:hypothetical protein
MGHEIERERESWGKIELGGGGGGLPPATQSRNL